MPPKKNDFPSVPSAHDNNAYHDDDVFSNPELAEDLYQLTMFGEDAAARDAVVGPAALADSTAANMPNSWLGDDPAVQTATVLDDYAFPMSPNIPQPAPVGVGFADAVVVEDGPAVQVVVTDDAHDNAYATVAHGNPLVDVFETESQTPTVAAADTNAVQPSETSVAGDANNNTDCGCCAVM